MATEIPELPTSSYLCDPDVQLFLEFQRGSPAAFETLMRKYYKRVLNFIYRFLGDEKMAEDLTQEVFLRAYQSVATYRPQSKLQTWLFAIAHNLSLNELRRRRGKVVSLDETFEEEDSEVSRQVEDKNAVSPDAELLADETREAVRQAIAELPENQRTAVLLRRYEEFSYEEIARTMNCSVKAVKSILNRAKENLKVSLARWIKDSDK